MRRCAWIAFAAAVACSTGTPYAQVAATMPAPPPGQGRILLYMSTSNVEVSFWPDIGVDGEQVGQIRTGTFFYLDRAAGPHEVAVRADPHLAGFGDQGATTPVTVLVQPGQTAYVQVSVVPTAGMVTVVLTPEEFADAQRDLSNLRLVPPAHE